MIVDHISTSLTGGAGNAARQLHRSLIEVGIISRLWHAKSREPLAGEINCQSLVCQSTSNHVLARLSSTLSAAGRRLWMKWQLKRSVPRRALFTLARTARRTPWHQLGLAGDILHLHWIARLIDIPSLFDSLPSELPIIWTLHDMNPLTGGCHYSGGCERFVDGCGHCPQLRVRGANDLSRQSFRDKHFAFWRKNLHIVTPSRWLETQALRSPLLSSARSVRTIHNGIDVDVFSPHDKRAARAELSLPQDGFVIAFGADYFGARNSRKGFHKLVEALSLIESKSQLIGMVFGNGVVPKSLGERMQMRATGFINDPHRLAALYSAADAYILPSLEDNLPTTGLEAMACGTPVVAFATGGITDFVRPGETGCLARTGDAVDLARQIMWLMERPDDRRRMGEMARHVILRDFHHVRQAGKHLGLYRSLLEGGRAATPIKRAA